MRYQGAPRTTRTLLPNTNNDRNRCLRRLIMRYREAPPTTRERKNMSVSYVVGAYHAGNQNSVHNVLVLNKHKT